MVIKIMKRPGFKLIISLAAMVMLNATVNAQSSGFPNIEKRFEDLGRYKVRTNVNVPLDGIKNVNQASLSGSYRKADVERELGYPNEGVGSNDNWYYVFNLEVYSSDQIACQYRVRFVDGDLDSTTWRRSQCQKAYKQMVGVTEVDSNVDLNTNVLFGFNSEALTPSSKGIIQDFVVRASSQLDSPRFQVTGHADSIGSDSYNEGLSQRRAKAVLQEMRLQGVVSSKVSVGTAGSREPLTDCYSLSPSKAVGCNAPNRRVSIKAF